MGGPGIDAGVQQAGDAVLDVAVVADRQRGDADDAGLPWSESGRLDVDDRPARAGFGSRPAPGCGSQRQDGTAIRQASAGDAACRAPKMPGMVTARGRIALAAGAAARWSSRVTGRGAGAMIGGLVAMTLDKSILRQLGESRRTAIVTGTNGKSTTTRMTAAALGTLGPVATNAEGANMDAGLVAALAGARDAELAALEVDEMHVPHVADAVDPQRDRAAEPVPRSARPGRRDQPHRAHAAGRAGPSPRHRRRRQLRRRADDVGGLRQSRTWCGSPRAAAGRMTR